MEYLLTWLEFSGIGILFGFFPALWTLDGVVAYRILVQNRKIPYSTDEDIMALQILRKQVPHVKHAIFTFIRAGKTPEDYKGGIIPVHNMHRFLYIISIIFIVIVFFVYQYYIATGYIFDIEIVNMLQVVILETSFPPFMLLTWLLPPYFLKRYLRNYDASISVTAEGGLGGKR